MVDWGESFPTSKTATATHLAQPCDLKSPETFFVGSVDYRHDLWRAGCMVSLPVCLTSLSNLQTLAGLTSRSTHYSIKGHHLGSPLAMPRVPGKVEESTRGYPEPSDRG